MKLPGRWWWMGAIASIVLGGGGWWLIGRNREPRYEGRTAEQWFKLAYRGKDSEENITAALRALRTNALPYLVGVAFSTNQDPALRTNLNNLISKLPDSWDVPKFVMADDIRETSLEAIGEIKPSCQELMPLIRDALEQTNSPHHIVSLWLLGYITNEQEVVVSRLLKALREPNADVKRAVAMDVYTIGTNMEVSNLVRIFQEDEPGSRLRLVTARVISQMNSNAVTAVPVLKTAFENETDWRNRARLAAYLWQIEPEESCSREYLEGLLSNNPSSKQISYVAIDLKDAGPVAKACVPALLYALSTTNCDEQAVPVVTGTLRQLGASDQSILDVMLPRLENGSLRARDDTLEEMGTNTERILDGIITNHSDNELWAVRLLAIRGTVASAPVLKLELNSTNKDISNAAAYSMQMVTHR